MNGKIRRVITGHDENGKAIVIEDQLAPAVRTNPLRPGYAVFFFSLSVFRRNDPLFFVEVNFRPVC